MQSKNKIVVIDYGMGNLRSVKNRFKHMDVDATISSDLSEIAKADKLILPGVGHFEAGMKQLKDRGLLELLEEKVIQGNTPILGICLGMQLFTNFSEEGNVEGLGWIDAQTKKFDASIIQSLHKVPHMGWNSINVTNETVLTENLDTNDLFYFVHSYHVVCETDQNVLTKTTYGYEFVSAIFKDNIYGVQFHPEKSHDIGKQMIGNFVKAA